MLKQAIDKAHVDTISGGLEIQFNRIDDDSRCVVAHVRKGNDRPDRLMLLTDFDMMMINAIAASKGLHPVRVDYYAVVNVTTCSLVVEHHVAIDEVLTKEGQMHGQQQSPEAVRAVHHLAHSESESRAARADA